MPFVEILTVTLAAAAVAFAGSLISGFAGFGLNLVITPILATLLSPVEAVPVVMILSLVNSARMRAVLGAISTGARSRSWV